MTNHKYIMHQAEPTYQCDQCPAKFKTPAYLKQHLSRHTGEKPYQCVECGKCFRTQQFLTRHAEVHVTERLTPCRHCPKTFKGNKSRQLHELQIHGQTMRACEKCGSSFNSAVKLRRHIKRCEARMEKQVPQNIVFPCPHCQRVFATKTDMINHRNTHSYVADLHPSPTGVNANHNSGPRTNLNPGMPTGFLFTCGKCKQRFKTKPEILEHAKTHLSSSNEETQQQISQAQTAGQANANPSIPAS